MPIVGKRDPGYELYLKDAGVGKLSWYNGAEKVSTNTVAMNVWTHIEASVRGTSLNLFKNGVSVYTAETSRPGAASGNAYISLALSSETAYTFPGNIDEVRISSVARSTNWVWAEFQNMASNSAFQSYGSATAQAGTPAWRAGSINWRATQHAQPANWPRRRQ